MPKRVLQGVVVSNKTQKTVTVLVERKFLHPVYKKIVRSSKKYAAHDETSQYKIGDIVRIQESRPISKTKKWVAIEKVGSKNIDTAEDKATA
jgi:small subunit ribosomal protein S17